MRRNPGLDLLRGLAILLVVIHHVALRIPLRATALAGFLPRRALDALAYNGYEAVFVFFVISGFLIAHNALERWGRLGAVDLKAFYVRRASRILPCLLALVALLAVLHLAGARDYLIHRAGQSLPRAIGSALGLHLNWYEGRTGYLPGNWDVLWSLSIEEVFYLGFPLLCLALRRERWMAPVLLVLALSLPWTRAALQGNPVWQEKAYLPGMAAIATGVLTALLARRWRPSRPWTLAVPGALGLAAVLGFEDVLWKGLGNGTLLILTGSSALLALASLGRDGAAPAPVPGTGWIRACGRLSYEIYLTHMFVVWPVVRGFKAWGGGPRWGFLWYVPAIGVSWALGWIVAKGFSVPVERALRRTFGEA